MTFKDLENWQKNLVVKGLNDDENIYIEYTKDDIIASFKQENQELKRQQKEFIDWLTNESKELIRDAGYHQRIWLDILSKYKEIIGGNNE